MNAQNARPAVHHAAAETKHNGGRAWGRATKHDDADSAAMREVATAFEIAHSPNAPRGAGAVWVSACERHEAAMERWAEAGAVWGAGRYGLLPRFARKSNSRFALAWS